MTAIKSPIKATNSFNELTENQDQMAIRVSNASNSEGPTSYHQVQQHQVEQEYYNKASGCSVRAQADNLFDYSYLRIK